MRILQCVLFVVSIGATVLGMASSAQAQRGGGRGMMQYNRAQLCSLKEVQSELKLSDEQQKLATEIFTKYTADVRELFQNAGGDFAGMMEKSTKLGNESSAKILEKLEEGQRTRLMQIYVQSNGTNALFDTEVQKGLKITDDQAKKLADARNANREAMMSAFGELQGASQEDRQKKMQELQNVSNEKYFGCISADQKIAFEKMGGTKIEIDLSPLAPRRPNN